MVEPETHVLGQVLEVVVGQGCVTIGEDALCTVITSDDDKAGIGVHDIVGCLFYIA